MRLESFFVCCTIFIFVTIPLFTNAQVSSVGVSTEVNNADIKVALSPENLSICGANDDSKEVVSIIAKTVGLSDVQIVFDLPDGVLYDPSSLVLQSGAGYVVSELDISDLNQPEFSISNGSSWQLGDEVVFEFSKTAGCEAVTYLNNGNTFKDKYTVSYAGGIDSIVTDDNVKISSYQLLTASLSMKDIDILEAGVGDELSRDIVLEQAGNGSISSYTHYVVVGADLADYSLSFDGTVLSPSIVSGDTFFYAIDFTASPFLGNLGDGDDFFENGETLTLTEEFKVNLCDLTDIQHTVYWGCNEGEACQEAEVRNGSLSFESTIPKLEVTGLNNAVEPEICGATHYQYIIKNTTSSGAAGAYDVYLNIGLGASSISTTGYDYNPLYSFSYLNTRSIQNFAINGNTVSLQDNPSLVFVDRGDGNTLALLHDFFTADPDGTGGLQDLDGDSFFDDLANGDSIVISFDFYLEARQSCGLGSFDYFGWENLFVDVNYRNQCKTDQNPERINVNYVNFIRDPTESTTSDSPADIDVDVPFKIDIDPFLFTSTTNIPYCNGKPMTGVENDSVLFEVVVIVPKGIGIDSSTYLSPNLENSIISFKTGVTNDTVIYAKTSYHYGDEFDVPLNLYDVSSFEDQEKIELSYFTRINCKPCFSQKIHCGDIPSMRVHLLPPCVGARTAAVDANRITAGWEDYTKTTKVTLDKEVHHLNYYLPYDTMQVDISNAIIDTAMDNLHLQIEYIAQDGGGGDSLLSFVSGQIMILDASTGTRATATLDIAPTPADLTNGNYNLSFDLSSYTELISPSYHYGDEGTTDSVKVCLLFLITPDFDARKLYYLDDFRASIFTYDTDGVTKLYCDEYGDRVFYNKQEVEQANHVAAVSTCNSSYADQFFTNKTDVGDLFPDEYRPIFEWDSTVIELPTGISIESITAVSGWEWQSNKLGIAFDSTYRDGSLILTRNENFIDSDMNATSFSRFRLGIKGSCLSLPMEPYDATFYYKEFAYSASKLPSTITNNNRVDFTSPIITIEAVEENLIGSGYESLFELEVKNTGTTDVPFNWFLMVPNEAIQLSRANLISGTDTTSLSIAQDGDSVWVEIGELIAQQEARLQFYANYSSCEDQTVTFKHGWNCSQDLSISQLSNFCYKDSVSYTLVPKEAQVQLSKVTEPTAPINWCAPFEVALEINSAQVADFLDPLIKMSLTGGAKGLIIDSVLFEYPKNSGNIQQISPQVANDTFLLDLKDHSLVSSINGIYGTNNAADKDERAGDIRLFMRPGCDFVSNNSLIFEIFGTSACGSEAIGNGTTIATSAIIIHGAEVPYIVFNDIQLPNNGAGVSSCNAETVSIHSVIKDGTTGSSDSTKVTLPEGLSYVDSSFYSIDDAGVTLDTTYYENGQQVLKLSLPAGVASDSSLGYAFDVIVNSNYGCSTEQEINVLNYVNIQTVVCTGLTCGGINSLTGNTTIPFPIAKPMIALQNTSQVQLTLEGSESTLAIDLALLNTGTAQSTSSFDAVLYCADSLQQKIDTAIDTISFSTDLAAADSNIYQLDLVTLDSCNFSRGFFVELVPKETPCFCESDTASIFLPTTIINNNTLQAIDDSLAFPIKPIATANVQSNLTINDQHSSGGLLYSTLLDGTYSYSDTTHYMTQLGAEVSLHHTDGTFRYTGTMHTVETTDTFQYVIRDNHPVVLYDTATVLIYFLEMPPQGPSIYTTSLNKTDTTYNIMQGKSDPNEDSIYVNTTNFPTLSAMGANIGYNTDDSTLSYSPPYEYVGQDTVIYQICDTTAAGALCSYDTLFINVIDQKCPPVHHNDYLQVYQGETGTVNLLEGNTDPDPLDSLSVNTQTMPTQTYKQVAISYTSQDSLLRYTAPTYHLGYDTLIFEVCDTTYPSPLCTNDTLVIEVLDKEFAPNNQNDYLTVVEKDTGTVNLLRGNTDLDFDALYVNTSTLPTHSFKGGSISYQPLDSLLTYIPSYHYVGRDTLVYQVCDTTLPTNLCSNDTLFIRVKDKEHAPETKNDTLVMKEDQQVQYNILVGNTDLDHDALHIQMGVSHTQQGGTVYYSAIDSMLTYTPPKDYFGQDFYVYEVCDTTYPTQLCTIDTLFMTIATDNDTLRIITTERDQDQLCASELFGAQLHDKELFISDSALYAPTIAQGNCLSISSDTVGIDTVAVYACLGAQCDTTILMIQINDYIGIPPVAINDIYRLNFAEEDSLDPLVNDYDEDSSPEQFVLYLENQRAAKDTSITTFLGGKASIKNGKIYYQAPPTRTGGDYFQYILCDEENLCDTARIDVTIFGLDIEPMVITPNDDGYNDCLVIPGYDYGQEIPDSKLDIFNRWGNLVYHAESYYNNWCGEISLGKLVPSGTYFFVLTFKSEGRTVVNYVYVNK